MACLAGCSTEYNLATQKQESLIYGTDKEVAIGDSVAQSIEKKYDLLEEVDANERAQRILDKIVAVCDRRDVVYFIKIIEDEEMVNAVSLPGGHIYLFSGLIDAVKNDDQLASVIAHEVAHITARHGIKRLQASYGAAVLQIAGANAGAGGVTNLAINSLFSEYSQQDELEADALAVKYMEKAGYDTSEIIGLLEILKEKQDRTTQVFSYFKTHPGVAKRISNVNAEIKGKMEFRDYLNLINNP